MAIANYLKNIKSSGIYRFVFDKSQLPAETTESLRLYIGYADKGPINSPVYVDSKSDYKNIFGDVSKKLERYGDFFNRSCLEGLNSGPIFAMNVKNFGQGVLNSRTKTASKTPSDEAQPIVLNVSIGQRNLYEKYGVVEYDFTAYNNAIIDFLNSYDGYDTTTYVANKVYTAETCLEDEKLSKQKTLMSFDNTTTKKWTIVPLWYKKDEESQPVPGIQNTLKAKFDLINPKWNTIALYSDTQSYSDNKVVLESTTEVQQEHVCLMEFDNNTTNLTNIYSPINVESIYNKSRFWFLEPKTLHKSKYFSVAATDSEQCSNTIVVRQYTPTGYDITFKDWFNTVMNGEELPSYLEGHETEKLQDYFIKIYVFNGEFNSDMKKSDALKKYFRGEILRETITNAFGEEVDALDALTETSKSNFVNVYSGIIFPDFITANNSALSIDSVFNSANDTHKMMLNLDADGLYNGDYSDFTALKCKGGAFDMTTTSLLPYIMHYIPGYVYGLSKPTPGTSGIKSEQKLKWQNDILNALKGLKVGDEYVGYKGLRIALTDRTSIEYHYLIDTFESYITEGCKSLFGNIAKEKDNALAILNFPSSETIKENSAFVKNNIIDFEKLMTTNSGFSLVSEEDGASYVSYYTPVLIKNSVTGVKTIVPSAGLVANNFMDKYVTRFPFSIVAGPNYGRISIDNLVGPEYNFSRDDLNILEPAGVNCMVYAPRKGTFINSNQTAKQNPVTALSKTHIRELVIYLQDEIEKLLQDYQWEFNTQTLRDTVKSKADVILETCKNNSGIYAYTTQCDEKNNTQEVIDNEMLILDYGVEPARGAGKMVQQLTIHRTGGLTSTMA